MLRFRTPSCIMPKKEVVTGSGVCLYVLLIFPLMLYAVAGLENEFRPENQGNSTVSQLLSEVLISNRVKRRTPKCLEVNSCWEGSLTCNCDGLCELYGDCCHDYNRISTVDGVLPSPELIDCVMLLGTHDYRIRYAADVFAVSRCPVDYGDIIFREYCESSDSEPSYHLPVYGRKSKVLYRNWYCAVCNQELDVAFWEVWAVTVEAYKYSMYPSSGDGPLESGFHRLTKEIQFLYFNRPHGFSPRRCLRSAVRKCAENWTDQETAMRCEGRLQASAYVYVLEEWIVRTYRNPDCAACNYVDESNTLCYEWPPIGESSPYGGVSEKILFNINFRTTNLNGMANELPECERGTVYHPSAKSCIEILCLEGSKGDNGSCKTTTATKKFLSLTESLNCTEFVKLNASEFTFSNNQSSLVRRTRSFYAITDYVIDSYYVYICLSYVQNLYSEQILDEKDKISFQFDRTQGILSLVGSIISMISLFLLFVVYLRFPVLRNVPGKCVMCLAVSLFSAHLLFVFVSNPGPVCFYLSAAIHFAYLASFCWMNVLAIDICRTFASGTINSDSSRSTSKHFVIYSLYSWTLPAAITSICLILDIAQVDDRIRPHYGREVCWITNQTALLGFFMVPVAVLLTVNFVLFAITACALRRAANDSRMATQKSSSRKARLLLHAKLSIIMGLPWVMGYVGTLTQWTAIWYLFIVFNSMQGIFLCVSFVCTKKVFGLIEGCLPWSRSSVPANTENKHGRIKTM